MDDSLPSYGQATTRDYWSIIASFVRSTDLCSAALVCRQWNEIFSPLLWGNPASHFGKENDAVYVALVRFKRTLLWARKTTRELTHTMHFPPAQAEIYGGPRSEWLSDILHRLPRLQSLVVSYLPFFDHGALSSLARLSQPDPARQTAIATYHLRLLDASDCNNITPQVLAGALKLFPVLVYLDLSATASARYSEVLNSLAYTPALQILKLQRLMLNDDELVMLIKVVGRNLRSLDIRRNRITDRGIRNLIRDCMKLSTDHLNGYISPALPATRIQQILDSDSQDDFVRSCLTTGFTSYLGIEGSIGQGITHLYASENMLTAAGASDLIECKHLRVLDVGNIMADIVQPPAAHYHVPASEQSLPTADKLTPLLESHADKLTYLRINHAVITKLSPVKEVTAFEMASNSAFGPPQDTAELEAIEGMVSEMPDNHINELEANPPPYAELEGSSVQSPISHPSTQSPEIYVNKAATDLSVTQEPVSALIPTLDASGALFSPVSPLFSPAPLQYHWNPNSEDGHLLVPTSDLEVVLPEQGLEIDRCDDSLKRLQTHRRSYSGVLSEHEARLRYRQSQDHALLPGMLGHIRTLVLTDVPTKSTSPDTAQRIIDFIKGCAEEEKWAALQASVGYQMPPGPDRLSAERHYARSLFSLTKLVLEMAPEREFAGPSGGWSRIANHTQMLSSTLDPDCETYLTAAKDDFSFFGSEECGQPDTEGLAPIPIAAFTEKLTIDPGKSQDGLSTNSNSMTAQQELLHDVLAEVSRFRKTKKGEHEAAIADGTADHVDGYWSGIIEIVRPRH